MSKRECQNYKTASNESGAMLNYASRTLSIRVRYIGRHRATLILMYTKLCQFLDYEIRSQSLFFDFLSTSLLFLFFIILECTKTHPP